MKNNTFFKILVLIVLSGLFFNSCQNIDERQEQTITQVVEYDELHRPQYHFTPPQNWINDPNGLVYHNGEYHLFYQHNPFGDKWGHMSWGHAVSDDLLHWEHLPVALEEENNVMIFSGSAVSDVHNTSGFGSEDNPPLVAIYTGHHTDRELQDQRIAYSTDAGRTWTKYEGNPVLDEGMENFRDPKVIWHEPTGKWVMIVALPTEHKVRLYGSQNLIDWNLLSEFGPSGATGGVWECPDLFALPVDGNSDHNKWVLQVDLNPGAPFGGSGGQYFVGTFDGEKFMQDPDTEGETRWVDYGKDFYAVQSYANIPSEDGRRIWLAWMNNWQYAGEIPTSPWRGAMTIPREVSLKNAGGNVHLVQQPVVELQKLRGEHHQFRDITVDGISKMLMEEGMAGKQLEILVRFKKTSAESFGVNVRESENVKTVVGYDAREDIFFIDRSTSGDTTFSEHFPGRHSAQAITDGDEVTLHIFVDRSSVELFGNGGEVSITDRIFPSAGSENISIFSEGGTARLVSLDVWKLESVWNNN